MKLSPAWSKFLGLCYWLVLVVTVYVALFYSSNDNSMRALAIVISSFPFAFLLASNASNRHIESMQDAASRDFLTGLPSRRLFAERLTRALSNQPHSRKLLAVMMLDLDRFKLVNDTLGHPAGDRLLRVIAQKLQSAVRSRDTVARYGGDEFTVLLENLTDENEARQIARRMIELVNTPIKINGQDVSAGVSIGIAFSSDAAESGEELMRRADIAVYRAKATGSGRIVVYEQALAAPVGALSLESDLRGAIGRNEICLLYQPEVSLQTGRIVGFEALVRWRHPRLGLLPPERFIHVAEEIGVIGKLGNWVLREACSQGRQWQELFGSGRDLKISVNLSALEFHQDTLLADVETILEETGLEGRNLRLEITETALMENSNQAALVLSTLRGYGVEVALDDFGTGFSSLSYLQRFPVDTIKIDQSFLRDIDNTRSHSIVQSVIVLAHALDMAVTAEGIETPLQLQSLGALDCDRGQGYLFARPMDAASAANLLARNDAAASQVRDSINSAA